MYEHTKNTFLSTSKEVVSNLFMDWLMKVTEEEFRNEEIPSSWLMSIRVEIMLLSVPREKGNNYVKKHLNIYNVKELEQKATCLHTQNKCKQT